MTYLSPGLYPKETDFSFYVKQISTAACGMIGIAEKGPISKATLCTSWEQFLQTFGGFITTGYLAYAARDFFNNGGQVLWVTRTAHYSDITDKTTLTAVAATATLVDRHATTPASTLKVTAINEGDWGENISIVIANGEETTFTLTVKYKDVVKEVFTGLTMDEDAASHAELKINGVSEYIIVEDKDSATTGDDGDDYPKVFPAVGTTSLAGGNNGLTSIADADYEGDSSQKSGLYAFDYVGVLNIIAIPGVTVGGVINAGLTYCEDRMDCVFFADSPIGLTPSEVKDFRRAEGDYDGDHTKFNSSYGELFHPWGGITDPLTNTRKWVPPSGAVMGAYAKAFTKGNPWDAVAGVQRGRIIGWDTVEISASKAERDVLYPEGINSIIADPDAGLVIWGQKTLQSLPSATDRANVRFLMMYIEKSAASSGKFIVFEPNNPASWRAIIRLLQPFLQTIKDKGGVYDFAVICDEETNTPAAIDRNEMVVRIFVKPTKTAEFVELNFILSPTGGSFAELAVS